MTSIKGTISRFFKYIPLILFSLSINQVYGKPLYTIKRDLRTQFKSMCTEQEFSGVVLIAMDDDIIFQKACGLASRGFDIPNEIDTKFNLGSVGKLFTSVAIAQLVESGKISLSTPVSDIIPNWMPDLPNAKSITVDQLLIHASGLGSFMDDDRWKLGSDSGLYNQVKDYKPIVQADKLLFQPGKSQSYSNNGYMLLGAIVESITHMDYSTYLNKEIFEPAKMENTGIWSLDEIVPNRAEGYFETCKNKKCSWKYNNFEAPFIGSPAGGAYSTAEDLFKFSRYLHRSKLTNEELTQQILSDDIVSVANDIKIKPYKIGDLEIPENFSPYGFAGAWNKYGFAVWKNPALIGHTGGIQGASAFFAMSPDDKYTIIILSNISGSGPVKLYKNIREILGFSEEITNY